MKNYTVWSRVDESGAVTESEKGFDEGEYEALSEAVKASESMAGGSVVRNSDQAQLMPDHTWSVQ